MVNGISRLFCKLSHWFGRKDRDVWGEVHKVEELLLLGAKEAFAYRGPAVIFFDPDQVAYFHIQIEY